MCHSVVLIVVPLHSHSWTLIMFHTGASESHTTPSGKIQYNLPSPVFGSISNQFETFYIGPTLLDIVRFCCRVSYQPSKSDILITTLWPHVLVNKSALSLDIALTQLGPVSFVMTVTRLSYNVQKLICDKSRK